MEKQIITKLSEREHIKLRPGMYIGQIVPTAIKIWSYEDSVAKQEEVVHVPGLIKIINEIIDNSIDEFIKTNGQFSNEISVTVEDDKVIVQDNGRGIPVEKNGEYYTPNLCWLHARAGSNFDDSKNEAQIGTNGVGSFATAVFSKKFIGETDDGKKSYKVVAINNAETFDETVYDKSKSRGTKVTFYPDLESFSVDKIDDEHKKIIQTRLINLAITYNGLSLKFNGKKISVKWKKDFLKMFGEEYELCECNDCFFAVFPNPEDEFRHFSYVNGLNLPSGGTHIDLVSMILTNRVRDVLVKKYKTIKPADIKNKFLIVFLGKNFRNFRTDSQTKEKLTNSTQEVTEYLGQIDWENFAKKVLKNKAIIDPITEVYKLKEELKKRQELKDLTKTVKEVFSEKYYPSIGTKKYLMIVEGDSAFGGLSPALGRKECGYFTLKGKPLNAYSSSQSKFTQNIELSDLYKVVKNEGYEYLIYATDQDLDGFHIRGLLSGFIHRYLPECKDKIGILQTPVIAIKKNNKLTKWFYSLNDEIKVSNGETSKYYKGLGSWKTKDLQFVIEKDGLENMIDFMEFDNEELLDDWLSDSKSDKRKEYISQNEFSIARA